MTGSTAHEGNSDIITESPEFRHAVETSQHLIELFGTIGLLHAQGRISDEKAIELVNPFEPEKYKE